MHVKFALFCIFAPVKIGFTSLNINLWQNLDS